MEVNKVMAYQSMDPYPREGTIVMEVDDPMTVCTVNNPYEAEDIKTALQGQGISCQLNGDGQAGLSDSLEVGVLVRPRDADRALTIIQQNEANRQEQTTRRHAENHHPKN
jgi:hypothetical protein